MQANSTAPPFVDINVSGPWGPMFVGSLLAIMLWGIEALQLVWYFVHYPEDPLVMKLYTILLTCAGTAQIITLFGLNYLVLITHFGNIKYMSTINPWGSANVSLCGVVSFLAQCFFMVRIYRFAERPIIKYGIPLILSPLIVYELAGFQLYISVGDHLSSVTQIGLLRKYVISSFAAQAAVDVVIAIVMTSLLYGRRTGIKKADRLLTNLIIASINTGIWTALLAIAVIVIVSVTSQEQLTYAATFDMLPSVYINSVLCNLNIRNFIRYRGRKSGDAITLSTMNFSLNRPARPGTQATRDDTLTKQSTAVESQTDETAGGTTSYGTYLSSTKPLADFNGAKLEHDV